MTWFLYALIGPILWSLVNVADGFLVNENKKGDHPVGSLVIFSSLIGIFASITILFFTNGLFVISLSDKFILLSTGLVNIGWIILYLYALNEDEVSAIVPWFLTIPVFGYILSYFMLGETLTSREIFGGLIILFGAGILVFKTDENQKIKIKLKTVMYMLPSCILAALWSVLFKFVATDAGFWISSFWEYLGLGIAGVLLFLLVKKYRVGFLSMIKTGGKKIMSVNIISEVATIFGNLATNFAILLAPVVLIQLVSTFQPIFVFIMGIVGTLFFPKIINENISKRNILHKTIAIIVMIVGSIIILR